MNKYLFYCHISFFGGWSGNWTRDLSQPVTAIVAPLLFFVLASPKLSNQIREITSYPKPLSRPCRVFDTLCLNFTPHRCPSWGTSFWREFYFQYLRTAKRFNSHQARWSIFINQFIFHCLIDLDLKRLNLMPFPKPMTQNHHWKNLPSFSLDPVLWEWVHSSWFSSHPGV